METSWLVSAQDTAKASLKSIKGIWEQLTNWFVLNPRESICRQQTMSSKRIISTTHNPKFESGWSIHQSYPNFSKIWQQIRAQRLTIYQTKNNYFTQIGKKAIDALCNPILPREMEFQRYQSSVRQSLKQLENLSTDYKCWNCSRWMIPLKQVQQLPNRICRMKSI
jgi:hypothetical protein